MGYHSNFFGAGPINRNERSTGNCPSLVEEGLERSKVYRALYPVSSGSGKFTLMASLEARLYYLWDGPGIEILSFIIL